MRGQEDHSLAQLRTAVELSRGSAQMTARLATAYARAGQHAEATRILEALFKESAGGYLPAYAVAAAYANLGRADEAYSQLERALEDRSDWLMDLGVDPAFDILRTDRAFARLLNTLRLPTPSSDST
jgi:tetratricopeptide (TPR) repeat protein